MAFLQTYKEEKLYFKGPSPHPWSLNIFWWGNSIPEMIHITYTQNKKLFSINFLLILSKDFTNYV